MERNGTPYPIANQQAGKEPYRYRVWLEIQIFGSTISLLMRAGGAAVQEDQAEPQALLLPQAEKAFPRHTL
jgi:hypothetical protein